MSRAARAAAFLAPLAALIAALSAGPLAAAQEEPEVRVVVDNPRPAVDDVVRLTFVFSGPGIGGRLHAPAELPLRNLVALGPPSSATQATLIIGVFSRPALQAERPLERRVGPERLGKTYPLKKRRFRSSVGNVHMAEPLLFALCLPP